MPENKGKDNNSVSTESKKSQKSLNELPRMNVLDVLLEELAYTGFFSLTQTPPQDPAHF